MGTHGSIIRRALEGSARLVAACGVVPLLAAGAFYAPLVRDVVGGPAGHQAAVALGLGSREEPRNPDLVLIESVLEKRAPDLGSTLRTHLAHAISDESRRAGFDPLLILAVIDVESDFADDAVSPKGARGLMQIQPSTLHFLAKKEGLRLTMAEVERDPVMRVRLGIRYLHRLHQKFHGDLDTALMAYNAGPARIYRTRKEAPEDLEAFGRYARLVRRDFRRFREGEGLGGDWALAVRDTRDTRDGHDEGDPSFDPDSLPPGE